MKIEIYRVYDYNFNDEYKKVLSKYNLEIKKQLVKHTYTDDIIKETYYIFINDINDLFKISQELKLDLIINQDGTITIYDNYIE